MVDNGRQLEIEGKLVWHFLLINTNDTLFYRTKIKKNDKGYGFISVNMGKITGYYYKRRTKDVPKTASEKAVLKTAEATEVVGTKIAKKSWNQNLCLMWIQEMLNK